MNIIIFIIFLIYLYLIDIILNDNYSIKKEYDYKILSCSPKIIYLQNFITEEVANYCISYIDQYKEPSTVYSDGKNILNNIRTSQNVYLNKNNKYIMNIENKVIDYLSCDLLNIEKIQGVVYDKNQYYHEHYDFFSEDSESVKKYGNRIKTIIIYLNDVPNESGGETYFPKLNLSVQPKKLDALYFENIKLFSI